MSAQTPIIRLLDAYIRAVRKTVRADEVDDAPDETITACESAEREARTELLRVLRDRGC